MVAHLLKPAAMERAADLGERLRAPTDAKRNLDTRPSISDRDLQQTTEIVTRAADTIAEMGRRNKIIESEARKQVEHYKSEADTAHQRCAELQAKVESLQARMDELASEFQGRGVELQGKLTACRSDLEVKTRDADLARQWLVYLSNEVTQRLGDAPARLDDLARQTRVPFRDED